MPVCFGIVALRCGLARCAAFGERPWAYLVRHFWVHLLVRAKVELRISRFCVRPGTSNQEEVEHTGATKVFVNLFGFVASIIPNHHHVE